MPEYNDISWFVMLFACGMGNGLFFYSVYEPIYHYTERNRYSADPTLTDNQLAQTAILIPMFHFGKCYVCNHRWGKNSGSWYHGKVPFYDEILDVF